MPVEVRPEQFTMVLFDAAEIRTLAEKLASEIGLPADLAILIEVDETTPMGHATLQSTEPVVLHLESGALEDPKRPRQLNPEGAADVIGRLLFELYDRRRPEFAGAPRDVDLSLPHSVAWQAYCVGRLGRLGHHVQRQRRLYQFRNRHGFTDVADEVFDRLWTADDLTWDEIAALSDSARAAVTA